MAGIVDLYHFQLLDSGSCGLAEKISFYGDTAG